MKLIITDLKKKICSNALILFLILLAFSGCGSSNSTPSNKGENSKGVIKGTVTAASIVAFKEKTPFLKTAFAGNAGVAGAVCILVGTDNSATTDASGFFQMSGVPVGSYVLICKKTATDRKVYAFLEIVEVQGGETVDLGTVDIKKTGGIQGKATLADQTDHTGISVYIPGTSMQARTDATGAYLINDVPEGTYELHFEKTGYMTGKITGLPVISGETSLAEDMSISLSTGASGIISIENGKVYSNSRTITVYFTASDDARLYQISDNPNFVGAVWNTIPPSRTWIFDSDGEKRLYAKFADANGLESAPVSDSIIVDTTLPVNGSIVINNNASATNSTTVTLILSASDTTTSVTQMKISNTPDFANTEWESYTTTRLWTIPAGEGIKTVYVLYRDIAGNETTQALSDDIIMDTTIPVNPSVTIQEGAYTNNPKVHLNLSASEATFMKIGEDNALTGVSSIPFVSATTFTLSGSDGHKAVYVKYIDDAGNETDPISASIIIDTTLPVTPAIFNNHQTTSQTTFGMTLSTVSSDDNFANYQLKGGQYTDWTDTTETITFNFTLTQQGENTLSIRGKDKAGNLSNTASVTISLDATNPVQSDINAIPTITTATISWKTDEPTTGQIDLGLNQDYGTSQTDSIFNNSHTFQFTGLLPNTVYHYRITSTDIVGHNTISTDLILTTSEKISKISGSCALTASGGVKCWGSNSYGQLGDGSRLSQYGSNDYSTIPKDVVDLSSGVIAISSGGLHNCALTTSGGVKCWGYNGQGSNGGGGQLGNRDTHNSSTPVDVIGISSGAIAVTTGGTHTCAIISNGGVKCWGRNNFAQLGNGGATLYSDTPVDVTGLSSGVIAIDAGGSHTCVLTSFGGVKCWGENTYGQIGDGSRITGLYERRYTPVDVVGLSSGVIAISAGGSHTCAITSSGAVKCWGENSAGQLGTDTPVASSIPLDVKGLTNDVVSIKTGIGHTCALTSSGGVKCWGSNHWELGALGNGTTNDSSTPVDVVDLSSGVIAISPPCALTIAGGVKCWGSNSIGQLGDGTTTNRYTPVDVIGLH